MMIVSTLVFGSIWLGAAVAKQHDTLLAAYDFVIVGGGTSGLVIANRLSERKDFTVAVIEAGESVLNNFNVSTPYGYGKAFDTPIDWAYQTEEQKYAGGKKQTMRAGKAIGGTSTINGTFYHVHDTVRPMLIILAYRNVIYSSAKRTNRRLGVSWE
jgi:glycine/D-amino acid oxidase-like deaminating enzyme